MTLSQVYTEKETTVSVITGSMFESIGSVIWVIVTMILFTFVLLGGSPVFAVVAWITMNCTFIFHWLGMI